MTRSAIYGVLSIAAAAWLGASSAQAQYYGDPEPELRLRGHRDHTGFFSHISVGLGYGSSRGEGSGLKLEHGGVAYGYHIAIGGSVIPMLAVHFSAFGFSTFSSSLAINGVEDKDINAGTDVTGLGAGLTYYLPNNLYVSASGGLGLVNTTSELGASVGIDPGWAARASVGYEWWVGLHWGIGVAVEAAYFQATDESNAGDFDWSGYAIAPVFSATNN